MARHSKSRDRKPGLNRDWHSRTTAERSFYKALAELHRLRTTMREDALRREKEQEAAVHREMERLCFAPIAGARQFVSQTPSPASPAGA